MQQNSGIVKIKLSYRISWNNWKGKYLYLLTIKVRCFTAIALHLKYLSFLCKDTPTQIAWCYTIHIYQVKLNSLVYGKSRSTLNIRKTNICVGEYAWLCECKLVPEFRLITVTNYDRWSPNSVRLQKKHREL